MPPIPFRKSIDAHNMDHLQLRPNELGMWKWLMGHEPCCTDGRHFVLPSEWPESLQEAVNRVSNDLGLCGEVVCSVVADWVAGRLARPQPPGTMQVAPP